MGNDPLNVMTMSRRQPRGSDRVRSSDRTLNRHKNLDKTCNEVVKGFEGYLRNHLGFRDMWESLGEGNQEDCREEWLYMLQNMLR